MVLIAHQRKIQEHANKLTAQPRQIKSGLKDERTLPSKYLQLCLQAHSRETKRVLFAPFKLGKDTQTQQNKLHPLGVIVAKYPNSTTY
jgi:hypothetical protein